MKSDEIVDYTATENFSVSMNDVELKDGKPIGESPTFVLEHSQGHLAKIWHLTKTPLILAQVREVSKATGRMRTKAYRITDLPDAVDDAFVAEMQAAAYDFLNTCVWEAAVVLNREQMVFSCVSNSKYEMEMVGNWFATDDEFQYADDGAAADDWSIQISKRLYESLVEQRGKDDETTRNMRQAFHDHFGFYPDADSA